MQCSSVKLIIKKKKNCKCTVRSVRQMRLSTLVFDGTFVVSFPDVCFGDCATILNFQSRNSNGPW